MLLCETPKVAGAAFRALTSRGGVDTDAFEEGEAGSGWIAGTLVFEGRGRKGFIANEVSVVGRAGGGGGDNVGWEFASTRDSTGLLVKLEVEVDPFIPSVSSVPNPGNSRPLVPASSAIRDLIKRAKPLSSGSTGDLFNGY